MKNQKYGENSVAVCTFLGHREVYDADIDSMLQAAVDSIAKENPVTDFLIYPCGNFYNRCLLAVLKAKARYPENIIVTLVLPQENHESDAQRPRNAVPLCMADQIMSPAIPESGGVGGYKKILRQMIRQSTSLICCLYQKLYEAENQILSYARKPAHLHIVDITDPETEQAVLESAAFMSDRERMIFDKLNAGSSPEETARAAGISRERLRQVLRHGCGAIRKKMGERYRRMTAGGQAQKECVCSIFSVGEVTEETLIVFEHIISFLSSEFGAARFYVAQSDWRSGFMYVLRKIVKAEQIVCAAARDENQSNLDAAMIDDAAFCVCNLSASPFAAEIKERVSRTKRAVLIDMGRRNNWT